MSESTPSLPLQIRIGIRDVYEAKDGDVEKALASLNDLIGLAFTVSVPWVDIHRDLKDKFTDDKVMLVQSVCNAIVSFLTRLENLVNTDEKFQDLFLERITGLAKDIVVAICDGKHPRTILKNSRITLQLPSVNANGFRSCDAEIGRDLLSIFTNEDEETLAQLEPVEEDDWDTVNIVPTGTVSMTQSRKAPVIQAIPLPKLQSLERPEALFARLLPYVLVRGGTSEISIESSHAPTLELIARYFEAFARKDMNNIRKTPYMKVELHASLLGSGTMYDSLRIGRYAENQSWIYLNISLVLAFIEGVCAYELMPGDNSRGEFLFKRSAPFA